MVYTEDETFVAYWYIEQTDTEEGYWVDANDETSGYWAYDEGSTESGTWWHYESASLGTWYTSTSDSDVRYMVVTESDYCYDTNNGATDM